MRMIPLHLKLQGLWVGAALGELYAKGLLSEEPPTNEPALTVQVALPQTYRLCLLAARWLKQPGDINLDLNSKHWQDSLLNVLPLTFLYPAGSQELKRVLMTQPPMTSEVHPQTASSLITIIQTLEWLQRVENPQHLLPYLLQSRELKETLLAEQLRVVQEQLGDRRGLTPLLQSGEALTPWTPEQAIAHILYLLLSTPHDFELTVQRSAFALAHQPDLNILLAALSGFCNGFADLPLAWRWRLKTVRWSVAMSLDAGLCTLGNLCAAQWSGCYAPKPDPAWATAISPPGQLRPR
jgi:hypothetical protein